jgi:hypothetical protein
LVQELERREKEREQRRKEQEEEALKLEREFEELSNKNVLVLSKDTGDLIGFARTYEGTLDLIFEYLKKGIDLYDFEEDKFIESKELAKKENRYPWTQKRILIDNEDVFYDDACDMYTTDMQDDTMVLHKEFLLVFSEKFKEILDGKDWIME